MKDPIIRTKLHEDVANHIVERIRSQEWEPGMKLPSEPNLAQLYGVSRATVRSAIKCLQHSGILRARSGSGTYVSESAGLVLDTKELTAVMADPQNIASLVQARYILEPQLAALAAKYATADEVKQLFDILHTMEQNRDRHALMTHGYRFHQAVAEFSHNQVLYRFFQSAASQLRGLRVLDSLTLEIFLDGICEHRAIAEAIRGGDSALACRLMQLHLKKDYGPYLACFPTPE